MIVPPAKLGIVAGGGTAPRLVMEACRAQGRSFYIVCLEGQTDPGWMADAPHVWLPLGAGGKLRDLIKSEKIGELMMIGHVRRPSLLELKPDWLTLKILTRIGINMLGDDGLLRAIGHAMEQEGGVRVVGIQDILGGVLMRQGALGKFKPDAAATQDIARGVTVARTLGQVDVGQSVIVQQGIVLGVEGAEGTDDLITRCRDLHRSGPGGVLVKLSKPQQDNRFDLPTIGPQTLEKAVAGGLRGIAVEAGSSLIIERDELRKNADQAGLFIYGID